MRALGLLGGTFDPIHCAHLELAREVMQALSLGAIHLIPVGDPPHRRAPVASADDRLAMIELAIVDYPNLVADDRELRRRGKSYTVLTLSEMRSAAPAQPLALLLGADQFLALPTWHRWRDVFALAHVVVVARPGMPLPATLDAPLEGEWHDRRTTDVDALSCATGRRDLRPADHAASGLGVDDSRGAGPKRRRRGTRFATACRFSLY
jgi:nicotinate-nucleotide adenylyltransferase